MNPRSGGDAGKTRNPHSPDLEKITVLPARNKPLSQSAGLWRKKPSGATEMAKKPIKLAIHTRTIAAHGAPLSIRIGEYAMRKGRMQSAFAILRPVNPVRAGSAPAGPPAMKAPSVQFCRRG